MKNEQLRASSEKMEAEYLVQKQGQGRIHPIKSQEYLVQKARQSE